MTSVGNLCHLAGLGKILTTSKVGQSFTGWIQVTDATDVDNGAVAERCTVWYALVKQLSSEQGCRAFLRACDEV
ncbi:hypothetical protein [Nonomuraea typhae]|uniref:hypothetical protein n=1 Tax=Nonomuraea typhae TaxID=2603600 RepID=UPI0012F79416|nr:hypothetical protein [Nonomuraea typhae]